MRLRIDVRARNDILLSAIERKHGNISACCIALAAEIKSSPATVKCKVYELVAIRPSRNGDGRPRRWQPGHVRIAEALSLHLGIPQDDILPPGLLDKEMPELRARITKDVDLPELLEFRSDSERHMLPAPDGTAEQEEMKERLELTLATLTPREELVIRKRYGLGGQPESLDQLGAALGCGRERVRQIEAKAIRKLQHPVRAGRLAPATDWHEPPVRKARLASQP